MIFPKSDADFRFLAIMIPDSKSAPKDISLAGNL